MKKSKYGYAECFVKSEEMNKFKFLSTDGGCVSSMKNFSSCMFNKVKNYLLILLSLIAFSVAVFFAYKMYCMYINNFLSFEPVSEQRDAWGQMGDFFGGMLNPIFSLLGLVFLLVTIVQNQRELNLSRLELKESKEALEDQAITLKKQKFEDTFFSLLDQLNRALEKISEEKSGFATDYITVLTIDYIGKSPGVFPINISILQGAKDSFIKENQFINQYFRILYQILKFIAVKCTDTNLKEAFSSSAIKKSDASAEELFYSNIVRAFIIENLHYLMAINCYALNDDDQFMPYKNLLERYRFLEHMNLSFAFAGKYDGFNRLLMHEIVNFYEKNAFGKNVQYSDALIVSQDTEEERRIYKNIYNKLVV